MKFFKDLRDTQNEPFDYPPPQMDEYRWRWTRKFLWLAVAHLGVRLLADHNGIPTAIVVLIGGLCLTLPVDLFRHWRRVGPVPSGSRFEEQRRGPG